MTEMTYFQDYYGPFVHVFLHINSSIKCSLSMYPSSILPLAPYTHIEVGRSGQTTWVHVVVNEYQGLLRKYRLGRPVLIFLINPQTTATSILTLVTQVAPTPLEFLYVATFLLPFVLGLLPLVLSFLKMYNTYIFWALACIQLTLVNSEKDL